MANIFEEIITDELDRVEWDMEQNILEAVNRTEAPTQFSDMTELVDDSELFKFISRFEGNRFEGAY